MTQEDTYQILKMLVERIKDLEKQVLASDMNLMKAGFVAHSPRPIHSGNATVPDSNTISKMSWSDLDALVEQLEGQV